MRLDHVRPCGRNKDGYTQYMARCPAHDDRKASLSVSCGQNDVILCHCHAGCTTSDILMRLGLEMRDLYPDAHADATASQTQKEEEYVYQDDAGKPLLKKTKLRNADGTKTYYWQHRVGDRWEKGRAGMTPPLYGASSIKTSDKVFIVEGEKDVQTMQRLGYPCVSLADGASSKWHEEYNDSFAGLTVYILPDNDAPGADYAKMLAGQLIGVAKAVYILDLSTIWPDIPAKGDISDYAQIAGDDQTSKALRDMARCAEPWQKPKIDGLLSCIRTLDAFEEQETDWLVPGLIPKGQITTIAADGGVGKTTLWCELVADISVGKRSIFDPPEYIRSPQVVAFLTTEDSVRRKLKKKLREAGACERNIFTPDFSRDTTGQLSKLKFGSEELATFIRYYRPSLCVFDPIQSFIPSTINMGSRNAMRNCLAPLISLGEETGTTFLLICHTNKRKGAFGRDRLADSADIWDISRSVIMLGYTEDPGIRYISNEKNNYAELQETKLFSIDDKGQINFEGTTWKRDREFALDGTTNVSAPKREDCKMWIMHQLDSEDGTMATKSLEERAKASGYSAHTLRRAKDDLKQSGEIRYRQVGAPNNKVWYVDSTIPPIGWSG